MLIFLAESRGCWSAMPKRKVWRKNLFENFGFPDNYTDKSFLQELKTNVHFKPVSFRTAFLGAGHVSKALCCVVLFCLVFVYLDHGWIEAETVFIFSSIGTILAYLLFRYLSPFSDGMLVCLIQDLQIVLIFLLFGYVSSPILRTLTQSTATDTIYATTTFMMCIHLIFLDYNVPAAIVSSSLSLNAAIFGSICLASRLPSPFHAFVLLTLSVECFVLLPHLMSKLGQSTSILFIIVATTLCLLWTVSTSFTVVLLLAILFINVFCPLWFVKWQLYKKNIYGPWDEAVVKVSEL